MNRNSAASVSRAHTGPEIHVMLAGGSASLPGLTSAVTQHSSFECSLLNPFEGMALSGAVRRSKIAREAPSYLTSCGLAMRRFLQ